MHIRTQTEIAASPEACWRVLKDFDQYAAWNPVISEVSGQAVAGGKGGIKIKLGPGPALPVPVKFLTVQENRELRWRGGNDAVFAGEHYFVLEPVDNGKRTRLIHGEDFSGIVVKLLAPLLSGQIERRYRAFNEAFKSRVERAA